MYAQPTTATRPQAIAPARPSTPMTAAEWAARIIHRHPHMAAPVALALELVERGHVTGNEVHCTVINAKRDTRYSLDYHSETGVWSCTCPAYQHRPYRAGRTAHCKHTLARAIAERAGLIEDK